MRTLGEKHTKCRDEGSEKWVSTFRCLLKEKLEYELRPDFRIWSDEQLSAGDVLNSTLKRRIQHKCQASSLMGERVVGDVRVRRTEAADRGRPREESLNQGARLPATSVLTTWMSGSSPTAEIEYLIYIPFSCFSY